MRSVYVYICIYVLYLIAFLCSGMFTLYVYYTSELSYAVACSHCMYIKPDTFSVQYHIRIVSILTPNTCLTFLLLSNDNKSASYLKCLFPANLRGFFKTIVVYCKTGRNHIININNIPS